MSEPGDSTETGALRAIPISELVARVREGLAREFGSLWVEGEITSLHRSRPGHVYFDLKDPDAMLRCVMFRGAAERAGVDPEEGMGVRVFGRVDVYAERGSLQLVIEELEPWGTGALRQAFEQMRQRLLEEGLFDAAHKRPLPFLPRRVGVVSSVHGAALYDLVRGLRQRAAPIDLVVCDARVQGEGAWRELVRALHLLDAQPGVEAIVLCRGGGSVEDLWNFNRPELVRAIFELETPVVSAVGHEVDLVLTDLVADLRAPTPTAAAALVVPDARELLRSLGDRERRIRTLARARMREFRHLLSVQERGLVHPAQRLEASAHRLDGARHRLEFAFRGARSSWKARLEALAGRLDGLSPLGVLGRGYSIVRRDSDGEIVRAHTDVREGDGIGVRLADGALRATVRERMEVA